MKDFGVPLDPALLNLDEKKRSNLLKWRGQFSPELIENLIHAYAENGDVLLDPFCGSGTLLYEAGRNGYKAIGVELNPSAYNLGKVYEFINLSGKKRAEILGKFYSELKKRFILSDSTEDAEFTSSFISKILASQKNFSTSTYSLILKNALFTILDFDGKKCSSKDIEKSFNKLKRLVEDLPESAKKITVINADCRKIPIPRNSADFVITSPPYINVFNYHQNYRKSTELLGWDILNIARSEIGSNRANRGNRYLTVTQYVNDMALSMIELQRCLKDNAKCIFIVGHESNVLGCKFFNSEIISDIASSLTSFSLVQKQKRVFKNMFGKNIREDILHFRLDRAITVKELNHESNCLHIAQKHLKKAMAFVTEDNKPLLEQAFMKSTEIKGTRIYESNYQ